jgi:hypothetical protein
VAIFEEAQETMDAIVLLPEMLAELVHSSERLRDPTASIDGASHGEGAIMNILHVTVQFVVAGKCKAASCISATLSGLGWTSKIGSQRWLRWDT